MRANVTGEARRHSTVAEAYEHYLRGRYHWLGDTTDGLHKAMEHFRRAIELDPSYALAYSGLADTYTLLGSYGVLPMGEAYPLGRAAARKALELDDTLGEAHNSLAAISADFYWEWAEAERHFKRAVELSPNYETALRFYAFYLACMGRHEEALAFATRARDLDPVSPSALMNLGDASSTSLVATMMPSRSFGRRSISLPTSAPPVSCWDACMSPKVCPIEPSTNWSALKALMGPRPDVSTPHAYVLARAGRQREARAVLDELRRISKPRDPAPFRIADGAHRPRRDGSCVRVAREGDRGEGLADGAAQRRAGLRRLAVGSALCGACRARWASTIACELRRWSDRTPSTRTHGARRTVG